MSNKIIVPIIIVLSLITIGVVSFTQLNKAPEKVAMNTNQSSEITSSVKSLIASSSSTAQSQVTSSSVVSSEQRIVESIKSEVAETSKFIGLSESQVLYYSGTLGNNSPIILKIAKNDPRLKNPYYGKYLYVGIGDDYINLEGNLVDGVFELLEKPSTIIKINPTTQTGSWTNGKNTYPIKLEQFIPDPLEPSNNPIEVGLLKKYKTIRTDYFDLICETSGKLTVGGCSITNKKGNQVKYVESFGFPKILSYVNKDYTELEFSFNGYGVCSYHKYQINNSSLNLTEVESYTAEPCQKKYLADNPINQ